MSEHRAKIAVDDQRGHAGRANVADDSPDFTQDQRRQSFGRFVEDQEVRIGGQRAADREHLLLAAGKLLAAVIETLAQPREGIENPFERPIVAPAGTGARSHQQILAHRKIRKDRTALRYVRESGAGDAVGTRAPRIFAADHDAPRRRTHQSHHRPDQRGLAHAIAPEQSHCLAPADHQRNTLQHVALAVVDVQILRVDERVSRHAVPRGRPTAPADPREPRPEHRSRSPSRSPSR